MRPRISRPRRLSIWLLLALALMLVPQFIGAAVGISRQQGQINDARQDGREVAMRLGRIAHLQSTLDATEDAVLRGSGAAGPRVRGTLARANADVLVLDDAELNRDFARLQQFASGPLDTRASLRRLEPPLDALRTAASRLGDDAVAAATAEDASDRSDQRRQLLRTLLAFTATLLITLLVARFFIGSIRRPLRTLRNSAFKLGSGDLDHRVELDSFDEFNEVADAFNAMSDALRRSDVELTHRAFHDPLTGLANRALMFDRITHALERRGREAIAVLLVDLDDFKSVNESLGHSRGDEALVEIGRRLRGVLRPSDTIARLGGDEFGILLEELSGPNGATGVAERILLALSSPVKVTGGEVELAASIGVAVASDQLGDADELMRAADLNRPSIDAAFKL